MDESNQPLIRLQTIGRVYRTEDVETHALSSIDLEIQSGTFLSIEGPSGCGKSTLLSILGLLDAPSSGQYWLNGRAVEGLSTAQRARARRQQIGFVFQGFNLIGELSVYENVELPLTYLGVPAQERRERVQAALDRVQMSHRQKHMPNQLSGGQQQRVAVARAVVAKPLILLADEPTGNLDSKNGEQVMALLGELHASGATLCMVTHDPRYASFATDRVRLFDGRIAAEQRDAEEPRNALAG
jgi:putative ABC transport system ATP-binding protein